jgi:hypothetical protein
MESSKRPDLLEYTVVRIGGLVAIATIGPALMTAGYFYPGVIVLYLALFLLAVDIGYESFFRRLRKRARFAFGILYVLVLVVASDRWIFVPAPLEMWGSSDTPPYAVHSMLNGIEWRPQYAEFDFSIKNRSAYDYDNLDVNISTDLMIEELKKIDGLASCSIETANPLHQLIIQNLSKPSIPAITARPTGGDKEYRIRCDKFPSHSQIDFFAATSILTGKPDDSSPLWPYAPPQAAKWFTMKGSFQTSGRNRAVLISACKMSQHCHRD